MISFFTGQGRRINLVGAASAATIITALYLALLYAPTDTVQGQAQRIFYIHVPMAWLAYLAYAVILVGSVGYLWKRDFKWDRLARSSAELGFLFTTLVSSATTLRIDGLLEYQSRQRCLKQPHIGQLALDLRRMTAPENTRDK